MDGTARSRVGGLDLVTGALARAAGLGEPVRVRGLVVAELWGPDGRLKMRQAVRNLITDTGDQYYASKGSGTAINTVTGMKLGTGSTAVAKNGAGAAIVTYVSAITASKAIDATFPTAATKGAGLGWRITWKTTWNAGEATQNSLAEVVLSNETALADDAGTAGNSISRALLSPVVNKGANDTFAVTWQHDFLGGP